MSQFDLVFPYPHREDQYYAIQHALIKQHSAPRIIHVFGQAHTDKTSVTLFALESIKIKFSYIDCISASIGSNNSILQMMKADIKTITDAERSIYATGSLTPSSSSRSKSDFHADAFVQTQDSRIICVLDNADELLEIWLNSIQGSKYNSTRSVSIGQPKSKSLLKLNDESGNNNVNINEGGETASSITIDQRGSNQTESTTTSAISQRTSDESTLIGAIYNLFEQLRVDGTIIIITQQKLPRVHAAFLELFIESQIQYIQFLSYSPQERYEIISTAFQPPQSKALIPNHIIRTMHHWFAVDEPSQHHFTTYSSFLPSYYALDRGLINPNLAVTFLTSTIISTLIYQLEFIINGNKAQLSGLDHTFQSILQHQCLSTPPHANDISCTKCKIIFPATASSTHFISSTPTPFSLFVPFHTIPVQTTTQSTITIPVLQILPLNHCRTILQKECSSSRHNLSNSALYLQCYYKLTIAAFYTLLQSLLYFTIHLHFQNIFSQDIVSFLNLQDTQYDHDQHATTNTTMSDEQPNQQQQRHLSDDSDDIDHQFEFSNLFTSMCSAIDESQFTLNGNPRPLNQSHSQSQLLQHPFYPSKFCLHQLIPFSRHLYLTMDSSLSFLTTDNVLGINPTKAFTHLYEPMYIIPPSYINLTPSSDLDQIQSPDKENHRDLRQLMNIININNSTSSSTTISLTKKILSSSQNFHLLLNFAEIEPIYVDFYLSNPSVASTQSKNCIQLRQILSLTKIDQTLSPLHSLRPLHYVMLLASFLASFVLPRDDAKIFTIDAASGKRRPRAQSNTAHLSTNLEHLSPQYARTSTFDRLLSIFRYVLMNSQHVQSIDQQLLTTADVALKSRFSDPSRESQLRSTLSTLHAQQNEQQQYEAVLFTAHSNYNVNTILAALVDLLAFHFIHYFPGSFGFKSTLNVDRMVVIAQQIGFNLIDLLSEL